MQVKNSKCERWKVKPVFACEGVHGLSVGQRRMLFSDVILDAGG